jgi:hypothetical protein
MTGVTTSGSNLSFSTMNLQLDAFSSLITSNSRITVEAYPTFQFDTITNGSVKSVAIPMYTYIQYGTSFLSSQHETLVAGTQSANGYSNFYQQPIKFSIPGTQVIGSYANPYVFQHVLPGGISYLTNLGFRSPNLNTYFASTNSYFLTVQNLSF